MHNVTTGVVLDPLRKAICLLLALLHLQNKVETA